MIYDHEAIALAYAYQKKENTKVFKKPLTVCFIDMGLSSSSITIITFSKKDKKTKGKLVYKASSKLFGTRYFDHILMKKFSKEFCEKT